MNNGAAFYFMKRRKGKALQFLDQFGSQFYVFFIG